MPQSLASILIHLAYSTKNREPLITPDLESELYAYQATVFKAQGCPALIINGTADHVHALFQLGRTRALCDVVEEVKKSSSKWLKAKSRLQAGFQWQTGYGAFSLGESGIARAKAYIANQKEHHRRRTFQEELRQFFRRYRIEYDERYVWD